MKNLEIRSKRYLYFLILVLIPTLSFADLTSTDDAILTNSLEILSNEWDQSAANSANAIFNKSEYTSYDFELFFNEYFNTGGHSFADPLWKNYLKNTLFYWSAQNIRLKLQMALNVPLWTMVNNLVASHTTDLGEAIISDALIRQSLYNGHFFFAKIGGPDGLIDEPARINLFEQYKTYIQTYPQYFSDEITMDNAVLPYIRAQVWISFAEIISNSMDEARKDTISSTIRISGKKLCIWDAFSVLVIDNNGADDIQLDALYGLIEGIPRKLHDLGFITIRDFFQSSIEYGPLIHKGHNGGQNYKFATTQANSVIFGFDTLLNANPTIETPLNILNSFAWNHIAATFDGSEMDIYINGEKAAVGSSAALPKAFSSQDLTLGRWMDQNEWLKGRMDEVKIYNRALSDTEINYEYNKLPVSTTGLVAHYTMDETGGAFVEDFSGLNNHGTKYGAEIILGESGNGLFFDGQDDFVSVADNESLRLNEMTLETWFYNSQQGGWIFLEVGNLDRVNIFSIPVGQSANNQFPDDIAPYHCDAFSIVAAHEFTHVVKAYAIDENTTLKSRHDQLIYQAGAEPLEYLRSQIAAIGGDPNQTYFQKYPQEFFASIANEYFANSWHTLSLGLQRFDAGYPEPINQFLFFADIISEGSNSTKVYTLDEDGVFTVNNAELRRDGKERAIGIVKDTIRYSFTLDLDGNVTSYAIEYLVPGPCKCGCCFHRWRKPLGADPMTRRMCIFQCGGIGFFRGRNRYWDRNRFPQLLRPPCLPFHNSLLHHCFEESIFTSWRSVVQGAHEVFFDYF
ncbi:MAG: LamG domain-containing protein [Desulfatitalea sp.]|nr:LamG domain-containing protein [Desulfatitalea sp.]